MKIFLSIALGALLLSSPLVYAQSGVLVLAHGVTSHDSDHHGNRHAEEHSPKKDPWEETVLSIIEGAQQRSDLPVVLAFGMWDQKNFQQGLDKLIEQGVKDVRVVPLFVSAHSDVIRAQHYMFRIQDTNPLPFPLRQLAIPEDVTIDMKTPLSGSPELTAILDKRAQELSQNPNSEELILVAHGPVSDSDDLLWLEDMAFHAQGIQLNMPKHVITVRDDADSDVQGYMTQRLRDMVQGVWDRGHTPLILPVLIAQGGIDKGILKRLEGLEFVYKGHMIAPDEELVNWILRTADL